MAAARAQVEVLTDALDEALANTEAPQGDPDLPARDASAPVMQQS